MKFINFCTFMLLFAATISLTGCGSEPTVIEDAPMTEQDMADYEAEMNDTTPIEQ